MAEETKQTNPDVTEPKAQAEGENSGGGDPTKSTSNSEGTGKTFTQAEMDAIIKQRIEREKKNMPDKEQLKAFKAWQDSQKTAEEKQTEQITAAEAAKIAAEQRAADFEAKYTAMSKGVSSDAVDDVIALAKVKVSDTVTLEQAIDSVIAKYPQFGGTPDKPKTTGIQTSNNNTNISGVEAAFLARNPDLKI